MDDMEHKLPELPATKIHAMEKIDATCSTERPQFAQWLVHRIEIWHFLHVDQIDDCETLDLLLDTQHLKKDHQKSLKQDLERKTKNNAATQDIWENHSNMLFRATFHPF